jgi:hypothetical protein
VRKVSIKLAVIASAMLEARGAGHTIRPVVNNPLLRGVLAANSISIENYMAREYILLFGNFSDEAASQLSLHIEYTDQENEAHWFNAANVKLYIDDEQGLDLKESDELTRKFTRLNLDSLLNTLITKQKSYLAHALEDKAVLSKLKANGFNVEDIKEELLSISEPRVEVAPDSRAAAEDEGAAQAALNSATVNMTGHDYRFSSIQSFISALKSAKESTIVNFKMKGSKIEYLGGDGFESDESTIKAIIEYGEKLPSELIEEYLEAIEKADNGIKKDITDAMEIAHPEFRSRSYGM